MAFQLLGPESLAASIFEDAGGSYLRQILKEPTPKFLVLPPEIRIQIYKNLLIGHGQVRVLRYPCVCIWVGCRHSADRAAILDDLHSAILRTARQVYAEAVTILYGDNKFYFACPKDFEKFTNEIGSVNAASLRHVDAEYNAPNRSLHLFWFFQTQAAVSSSPGLAYFSAMFTVRWGHPVISHFKDLLTCMKLLLQTHPRLTKLVMRRLRNHFPPEQRSASFQLVLVNEDYKLNCEASYKPSMDINGFSTELNDEVPQDVLVDVDVELAVLEMPREGRWPINAQSIFHFVSQVCFG
jgi:hypothetical protein